MVNINDNFEKVFTDRLTITLAGITLELIHAPGETNDQIIVWYPDQVSIIIVMITYNIKDNFVWHSEQVSNHCNCDDNL